MTRALRIFSLVPAVLALLTGSSPAWSAETKTLILRGRVTHEDGTPVERARIQVRGARSSGGYSDAAGLYQVQIRLSDPRRLAKEGLDFTVFALRPGWKLELPGGVPALRVTIQCQPSCRLSASDARVGEALTRCLDPGGPPGAVAPLNFVGRRRIVIYGVVRSRDLRGVAACDVSVAQGRTVASARTDRSGHFQVEIEPDERSRRLWVEAHHEEFDLQPTRRDVVLRETDRLGPVEFMALSRAGTDPQREAAALGEKSPRQRPPSASTPAVMEMVFAAALELPPPPAAKSRATTRSENPAARSQAPALPAGRPVSERAMAPEHASQEQVPAKSPKRTAAGPKPPPGARPPSETPTPDPNCRCVVRGILELEELSEEGPRVAVWLEPRTAGGDTVQFFMGAPRPFRLEGVPCGRYSLHARSVGGRSRWVLVNAQGLPEVHCQAGSQSELRVILERRPLR